MHISLTACRRPSPRARPPPARPAARPPPAWRRRRQPRTPPGASNREAPGIGDRGGCGHGPRTLAANNGAWHRYSRIPQADVVSQRRQPGRSNAGDLFEIGDRSEPALLRTRWSMMRCAITSPIPWSVWSCSAVPESSERGAAAVQRQLPRRRAGPFLSAESRSARPVNTHDTRFTMRPAGRIRRTPTPRHTGSGNTPPHRWGHRSRAPRCATLLSATRSRPPTRGTRSR